MAKTVDVGLVERGITLVDLSLTDEILVSGQGKKVKVVANSLRVRGGEDNIRAEDEIEADAQAKGLMDDEEEAGEVGVGGDQVSLAEKEKKRKRGKVIGDSEVPPDKAPQVVLAAEGFDNRGLQDVCVSDPVNPMPFLASLWGNRANPSTHFSLITFIFYLVGCLIVCFGHRFHLFS